MQSVFDMNRVHRAPTGFYAPMPEQRKGEVSRKLKGGDPPIAYRARNDWGGAARHAFKDGSSPSCNAECFHSTSEWNGRKFV